MSDFHYVRIIGPEGGVDACAGAAIGLDMASVLQDGLPPYNITLQFLAALCEILDIAEEDGRVHGDVDLRHLFIDDTGAVSLEAFGQTTTRAPEGRPRGPSTDLYGLGAVGYHLFAGHPLPSLDTRHPDTHDDAVIDAILLIPFEDLNEEMVGDVQWFLAKLLSHDPDERPSAVETWRTLIAFAEEARGPDFAQWCLDALEGGGERRDRDAPARSAQTPAPAPVVDLDGPLVSQGPLAKGGLAFNTANAAGGTAFFNKADMKAALEREMSGAAARQTHRPAVGGGSATNYWSRDELRAMAEGDAQAPRPKRAAGEATKRRTMATTRQELDEQRRREASAAAPGGSSAGGSPTATVPPPAPEPAHTTMTPVRSPSFAGPQDAEPDGVDVTVRMSLSAVRTTRTPAPAPQVFRPPHASMPPPPAPRPPSAVTSSGPPPAPEPQPSQVETQIHHVPPELTRPPPAQGSGTARPGRSGSSPPRPSPAAPSSAPPTPVTSAAPSASAASAPAPPVAPAPQPQPQLPVEPPAAEEERSNVLLIGGVVFVVAIAVVLCAGLGGLSAVVAVFSGGAATTPADPPPIEAPRPEPTLPSPTLPTPDGDATQAGTQGTAPEPAPTRPQPQPTRPQPQPTRPQPQPARPQPTRPQPQPQPTRPQPTRPQPTRPQPAAAPAPPSDGPVTLTLKTSGRGALVCNGKPTKRFDGPTSMNIERYLLPLTCRITMDGKDEAFQVHETGSVTCNLEGGAVRCDKVSVP